MVSHPVQSMRGHSIELKLQLIDHRLRLLMEATPVGAKYARFCWAIGSARYALHYAIIAAKGV